MSEQEHQYPPAYGRGVSWALDEAWDILDTLTPGALPDDTRLLLAGMIWGTLLRLAREGRVQPPERNFGGKGRNEGVRESGGNSEPFPPRS